MTPGRGASSRARWRCSARSTATRCASSRSATGRASSAAARTPAAPASSASIKLLGESSIGSGVRRVEALVGADAYRFLAREHVLVAQLTEALKARPEELPERVSDLVERLRAAEKEIEQVRVAAAAGGGRPARGRRPRTSSGVSVVGHRADGAGRRRRAHAGARRARPAAAGAARRGRRHRRHGRRQAVSVVAAVNDEARARGRQRQRRWSARSARWLGGKGGGKDDVAQGGGTDASRIDEALAAGARRGRPRGGRAEAADGAPTGVRLGIDPGDARIGVARSDPSGFLATPVETVRARQGRPGPARGARGRGGGGRGGRRAAPLAVGRRGARRRSRSGRSRPGWPRRVAPVPVRLCDERLTTVSAEAMLRDRGRKGSKRRAVVDQAAAVVILQTCPGHRARDGDRARRDRRGEP